MRWWPTFVVIPTKFVTVGRMRHKISFLCIIPSFQICILHFFVTILQWGSFGSLMLLLHNCILTRGCPFRRSEFFVIFSSLFPHLSPSCFTITLVRTLLWVGCLYSTDREMFSLQFSLHRTNFLKKIYFKIFVKPDGRDYFYNKER